MKNLAKKMVAVMQECSHVAKNGSNDFHKYKYDTAADVLEMVNESLTKHGIFTTVETNLLEMREVKTAKGNTEILASVETVVTLIDSDSDETATIKGIGSGQDSGDKSVMKAQTAAIKYAFLLSFAISTGDDPEADTHTDAVMSDNKNSIQYNSASSRTKTSASLACSDCGAFISQKVADYSKSKFGKYLCYDCQHSQEKVA